VHVVALERASRDKRNGMRLECASLGLRGCEWERLLNEK